MFEEHATHEFDDGGEIAVGEGNHQMMVVFDGPRRLETTIAFDFVIEERNTVDFYKSTRRRRVQTGSIEGSLDTFGAVGASLEEYEREPL
jgi:hypothetical protein